MLEDPHAAACTGGKIGTNDEAETQMSLLCHFVSSETDRSGQWKEGREWDLATKVTLVSSPPKALKRGQGT